MRTLWRSLSSTILQIQKEIMRKKQVGCSRCCDQGKEEKRFRLPRCGRRTKWIHV
ncbi:hypothetical protein BDA96_05G086900 [Sorghum bicolor]|uniref:Uncharacterized protein n=1 Tax=Sorghum bicolor TaxID=4558 RepID=A0A921QVC5_SORBI|nr:hypothetical protein BDA96_05G052000 [Sorghum bicolor]KAG0529303.1 hypothetical protein BDA96_05G086900 [Sorghum bicolor]